MQGCLVSSKDWDKKLEGFSRLWRLLSQRQQQVEEWFYRADAVINDQDEDTASLVQKHKVCYVVKCFLSLHSVQIRSG